MKRQYIMERTNVT